MRGSAAKNLMRAAACTGYISASGGPALAQIPATIKPGLWQVVMTMSMAMMMNGRQAGTPNQTGVMVVCSDGSLGAVETDTMPGTSGCTDETSQLAGNTLNVVTACPVPMGMSGPMTTHETLVFESSTAMHMESNGESPNMNMHMVADWTWQGACPPGVTAGETGTMEDGNFVRSSGNGGIP